MAKTVAGVTTKYMLDTQNPTGYAQVVYETFSGSTSANHEISRIFVYGLERISQFRSYVLNNASHTQTSYYVYDGHGSTRALTDPNGAVTDTYDYDAFGNLLHSAATGIPPGGTTVTATPNEFLFAGEQFDSDLGLYYNRARYLSTSTGRFWTMDSYEGDTESPLSLHKYLYANVDPANFSDASGHDIDVIGLAVALGIGLVLEGVVYLYLDQRIASSVGPFPLPTKEYFKVHGALSALINHLNAGCGICESAIFQKVGISISDLTGYLSLGAAFYDGTMTNMTLEQTGLGDQNQRVSDYFKHDIQAATKPQSTPMTTYWDPGYISSQSTQYLEAVIAHEAFHGYLGISDDGLKLAFFGPNFSSTGPAAGTSVITDYIYGNLR